MITFLIMLIRKRYKNKLKNLQRFDLHIYRKILYYEYKYFFNYFVY